MATITAIQKKDIDALERSLKTLSENMSSVANDVVDINGQINDFNSQVDTLKSNVKSLEQEIKDLMDLIVTKNIFKINNFSITEALEAKVVQTDILEYDLVV